MRYICRANAIYLQANAICTSLRLYVKRAPLARNYIITPSFHVPSRDISHAARRISRTEYISHRASGISRTASAIHHLRYTRAQGSRKVSKNFSGKGGAGVNAKRVRSVASCENCRAPTRKINDIHSTTKRL